MFCKPAPSMRSEDTTFPAWSTRAEAGAPGKRADAFLGRALPPTRRQRSRSIDDHTVRADDLAPALGLLRDKYSCFGGAVANRLNARRAKLLLHVRRTDDSNCGVGDL